MVLTLVIPRSTGKEFALKIIDKAKCCGKVSMCNCYVERMWGFTERGVFMWGPEAFVEGDGLSVTAREVIVFTLLFPTTLTLRC